MAGGPPPTAGVTAGERWSHARLQHDVFVLLLLLQLLEQEAQEEPATPDATDDGNLRHGGPNDAIHLGRSQYGSEEKKDENARGEGRKSVVLTEPRGDGVAAHRRISLARLRFEIG